MMLKVILICGLAGYLSNAAVIKGDNFFTSSLHSIYLIFDSSLAPISRGAAKGWCSVSEGVSMGNINDGYITEASGLAYSRRSGQVNHIYLSFVIC